MVSILSTFSFSAVAFDRITLTVYSLVYSLMRWQSVGKGRMICCIPAMFNKSITLLEEGDESGYWGITEAAKISSDLSFRPLGGSFVLSY